MTIENSLQTIPPNTKIYSDRSDFAYYEKAFQLAKKLTLEIVDYSDNENNLPLSAENPWGLWWKKDGLSLHFCADDARAPFTYDVLKCSLTNANVQKRIAGGKNQDLAKAVGMRKKAGVWQYPYVIDTTAGLGRDSAVLAHLGCTVTMIERHPLVAALLSDGLARASSTFSQIAQNLNLVEGEAQTHLPNLITKHASPATLYLDPMYPASNKGALPKKNLQILRQLLGNDEVYGLLETCLSFSNCRIVVKRPKHAPSNPTPNHSFKGKQTRFDVYLT